MEVRVATDTRAALEADLTLRCFHRTKFKLERRHSVPVIAWATELVTTICKAMLNSIGQPNAKFSIQMILVELLIKRRRRRPRAMLCYDVFLGNCNEHLRNDIDQSHRRPMHELRRRARVYRVFRSKKADAIIANEYAHRSDWDKGPRPYFVDWQNPPLYDSGRRVERRLREDGTEEEDADQAGMSVSEGEDEDVPVADIVTL